MPFVPCNGCRIYYRLEGSFARPLLVLVHSLGADHGMWSQQMPRSLLHFRVLRIDLRGQGASDSTAGEYSIERLAHDVLMVADHAGYWKFFYCGLSLGGMIGQWLAANAAERLERLVLANTSPRMPDPSLFEARRLSVLKHGMLSIADAAMQRSFSARSLQEPSPYIDSHRFTLLANDPIGYGGCCAAIRDMDDKPVLVIGGDEDASTPWNGHGDFLVENIPGATGVCLQAGHMSNIEQPDLFTSALLEFFLSGV